MNIFRATIGLALHEKYNVKPKAVSVSQKNCKSQDVRKIVGGGKLPPNINTTLRCFVLFTFPRHLRYNTGNAPSIVTAFVKILSYPHPVLKYKCKPILRINQELRDIVANMFETMYAASGVGLAANQVGLPMQLFVMNPTGNREEKSQEYVFINPVILKKNGNAVDNEGCLSFPDIHADVIRSESIEVESISLSGEEQLFQWKDRIARIVQHEIDHLNGVCFVERLGAAVKLEIREDLDEMQTVFESNQRLGFDSTEAAIRELEEYERKFC